MARSTRIRFIAIASSVCGGLVWGSIHQAPWAGLWVALLLGVGMSLVLGHPFANQSSRAKLIELGLVCLVVGVLTYPIVVNLTIKISRYPLLAAIWLAAIAGLLLGLGLRFVLSRIPPFSHTVTFPRWQTLVGYPLVTLAIILLFCPPFLVESSKYFGKDIWFPQYSPVAQKSGFTLYTDRPNPVKDAELANFLEQFRRAIAEQFFDPGPASCSVLVYFVRKPSSFVDFANQFGQQADAIYGFYTLDASGQPIVVVPEGAGLGTLTHEMMHHFTRCAFRQGLPVWVDEGIATLMEKFLAIQQGDRLIFNWGYRSSWRDPEVRSILDTVDLATVLKDGTNQSVFNSLFLFLYHRHLLLPFLSQFHTWPDNGLDQLSATLNQSIADIEQQWRIWLVTEALDIPMVKLSFVAWDIKARYAQAYLQQFWQWNGTRQLWTDPQRHPNATIPRLDHILSTPIRLESAASAKERGFTKAFRSKLFSYILSLSLEDKN